MSGLIDKELARMKAAFAAHLTPLNAMLPAGSKITPRAADVGGSDAKDDDGEMEEEQDF